MAEGAKILLPLGEEVLGELISTTQVYNVLTLLLAGNVTSGIPSPTLGKNIAMGYIKSGWHKKGTEVAVEVRRQLRKAVLNPMPFLKTNYWRG